MVCSGGHSIHFFGGNRATVQCDLRYLHLRSILTYLLTYLHRCMCSAQGSVKPRHNQITTTNFQEHCDGCMGCLALRLQGNIPPVTITVFLTAYSTVHHAVTVS